ncbi:MAG: hypothetical protein JST54_07015 [Deltaproteobacteria bacterium]|nr:hypothetical protein [Deltaproteobacteria bacterium]
MEHFEPTPSDDTVVLAARRSSPSVPRPRTRASGSWRGIQFARVTLPDATMQDVQIERRGQGPLMATLIDAECRIKPLVQLDFSEGATPRVTWAPDREVSLADSLEIVAKVCAALAQAAAGVAVQESAASSNPLAPPPTDDALEEELARALPSRRFGLALLGIVVGSAGLLAAFAGCLGRHEAHGAFEGGAPNAVATPVAATVVEPRVAAAAAAVPASELERVAPVPAASSSPAVAGRDSVKPAHRGHHLIARSERRHVKGLAPNTGLVALRTKAGLEVSLDGLWVGMTPVRAIPLAEGGHVLELRQSPKVTQVLDLEVTAGDEVTLFLELE